MTVVAYHTCYDCAGVPNPKECFQVVKCKQDAICYVEEYISDSGLALFNLGCRAKQQCGVSSKRESATGDLIVCEECCQGDHCNSRGCNSQPLPPIGTTRGPVCYSCHQHAAEDSCDMLQVCDRTESCFLSPTYSSSNATFFTSGCKSNNVSTDCVYKNVHYTQSQSWNDGCSQVCTCTHASTGAYSCRVRCLNWNNLPSVCTLEAAPSGLCCQQPRCPTGIVITIPKVFEKDYPGFPVGK